MILKSNLHYIYISYYTYNLLNNLTPLNMGLWVVIHSDSVQGYSFSIHKLVVQSKRYFFFFTREI